MTAFKDPSITTVASDNSNPDLLQPITEATARELVNTGAVRSVQVLRHGDAWAAVIRVGLRDRVIRSQRERVRTWRSLDTVANWVVDLGANGFVVTF
jgi:hypothetical protein